MHQHFHKHLNVKKLMRERKPRFVLEMGAGSGNNTKQIVKLQKEWPFEMVVINDGTTPDEKWMDQVKWINGVSYIEIPKLQRWVDFCSIDTDHNYLTLKLELEALEENMLSGGIVVMHDTETYGKTSGHFWKYVTNNPYPLEQIEGFEKKGLTMTAAIDLSVIKGAFKIIKETKASHGAIAMERL